MVRSAADIAELSLRKVGAFSTYDTGADAAQFAVAIDALDMMISEKVGTELLWWFQPASQNVPLTAGVSSYSLNSFTETDLQFIQQVFIVDENGRERELELLRKQDYEKKKTEYLGNGLVECCYIERKDSPQIKILRAPSTSGFSLRVEGQSYSTDLLRNKGQVPHGFPKAWERYLYHCLSLDLGTGLIVNLPESKLTRIENTIARIERKLNARNVRENIKKARYTQPYGI